MKCAEIDDFVRRSGDALQRGRRILVVIGDDCVNETHVFFVALEHKSTRPNPKEVAERNISTMMTLMRRLRRRMLR
jgi:hypothetical protein